MAEKKSKRDIAASQPDAMSVLAKFNIPIAEYETVERLPSGSLLLDYAIGGGWPRGRSSTLAGLDGYGKTTLALITAAETARNGGTVMYIDLEHKFDWAWAETMGIPPESPNFFLVQYNYETGYMENILGDIEMVAASKHFDLIVLDSVAALASLAEIQGELEDNPLGKRAQLLSRFFSRVSPILRETNVTLLLLNQMRQQFVSMGDPEIEPGGRALRHYPAVKIRLRKPEHIKVSKTEFVGVVVRGVVKKNSTAAPGRELDVTVREKPFGGVDLVPELFDLAKQFGLLTTRDGDTYSKGIACFQGIELANGRDASILRMRQDENIIVALDDAVRKSINQH
jgi:recombination protein RecA